MGSLAPLVPLRTLRKIWIGALLVMAPLVFFFASRGTWTVTEYHIEWSPGFYRAQADSMVHGYLNVDRKAIQGECFNWKGDCYGYFGITPSVIRLPFLPILTPRRPLISLFMTAAVLLAYWAALRLVERGLCEWTPPGTPAWVVTAYAILSALALGPGSTLLFLSRAAVFEEAIAWGVAFMLLTIDRVWAWYRTGRVQALDLAMLFGIAAVNARLNMAPACVLLGLTVAVLAWLRRDRLPIFVAACCLAILPGLTTAGVFWLKFDTPLPDWRLNEQIGHAPHWQTILQANGNRTASLAFAPTELVAYFRPDSLVWREESPHIDFRFKESADVWWLPPLPPNGAYVENPASLTATMPLSWLLNVAVMTWLGRWAWRRRRGTVTSASPTTQECVLMTGTLLAAVSAAVPVVTTLGITNRYMADFFTITAAGAMYAPLAIFPWLQRKSARGPVAVIAAIVLVAWSIFATVSLTYRVAL